MINFWYVRLQANKSAIKAVVVNKIGDFSFMLGIVSIFVLFKSVNFGVVFLLVPFLTDVNFCLFSYQLNSILVICFFLFLGAVGKSAQFSLHTWLPDAMEGECCLII